MQIRKLIFVSVVVGCVVSLSGCATMAEGPSFSEARATTPMAGKATVYVFRKFAQPTLWGATIHFDNQEVATLNERGFTWAYLSPGNHTIRAVWAGLSGQQDSHINLDVKAENTYYMELWGISQFYAMGSGLHEVKPEVAESVVSQCCKFQKPRSLEY